MNPTLLALSRAFGAIPGAPTAKHSNHSLYSGEGLTYFRDGAGIRWVDAAGPDLDDYEWLLDLDDTGMAGRLVADLQATGRVLQLAWVPVTVTGDAGRWQVIAYEDHAGGACVVEYAPTLGHAAALALLAVHEQEK